MPDVKRLLRFLLTGLLESDPERGSANSEAAAELRLGFQRCPAGVECSPGVACWCGVGDGEAEDAGLLPDGVALLGRAPPADDGRDAAFGGLRSKAAGSSLLGLRAALLPGTTGAVLAAGGGRLPPMIVQELRVSIMLQPLRQESQS